MSGTHHEPGSRRGTPRLLLLVGMAVAVRQFSGIGSEGDRATTVLSTGVAEAVDRPAPSFELPALGGGGDIALRDFAGNPVVVNFWARRLPPPGPVGGVPAEGVRFLGVDHRDEREAALAFQWEFGITYPSVFDPGGRLAIDYGLVGIPSTFVIGENGRIAYQILGKVQGPEVLREALEDVLGGVEGGA